MTLYDYIKQENNLARLLILAKHSDVKTTVLRDIEIYEYYYSRSLETRTEDTEKVFKISYRSLRRIITNMETKL